MQNNPSYSSVLNASIHNTRFSTPTTPKPFAIITPLKTSHVQSTIYFSKNHGFQLRIRSGGHDLNDSSYVSQDPFVILDLVNFREIEVDTMSEVTWVESGATLGAGGHLSGGGYGILVHKYGLSADHIIGAKLIDVDGRILNRKSMGEDLFWAIRGGGGNTFGIVLARKINLVGKKTVEASFKAMFLAGVDELIPLIQHKFPELGLAKENCTEMSWIESVLHFGELPIQPVDILLNRNVPRSSLKAKTDFVKEPIPETGIEGFMSMFLEEEAAETGIEGFMSMFPEEEADIAITMIVASGGKMDEIPENKIPFPNRAGNLFVAMLNEEDGGTSISWIRRLYSYMVGYVSKSPREAYYNYKDLDLGTNNVNGYINYEQANVWGLKYFKNNFKRLVQIKTMVDPMHFFRNEQSVPPLWSP
ncbi:hypothetical protein Gogos_002474 [Gossypium gossypioides]|uniref:FAD-binding PCMH-type domain-containing protein n=1 Tax=Gossypium gossypioides TaxID=34282 RepID=A0A7J9CRJ4_GOSGO|nr:hypothetical protein [Gossypium gossypioides]